MKRPSPESVRLSKMEFLKCLPGCIFEQFGFLLKNSIWSGGCFQQVEDCDEFNVFYTSQLS